MEKQRILIVDDDENIAELISLYLMKECFATEIAYNGKDAIALANTFHPDLILLDIMLPDIEGTVLSLDIRRISNAPIIFLSAKTKEIDKIVALSAGGDDYITKPFMPGELIARIKAHIRRQKTLAASYEKITPNVVEFDKVKIDFDTHECYLDGKEVKLTSKEFEILKLFIDNPRKVFPAEQIYETVWKTNCLDNDARTVMVYISTLRKKLESSTASANYIISVRGVGYKFNQSLLDE